MAATTDKTATLRPSQAIVSDGATNADVLDLTTSDALAVAILDATGNQITSFGSSGGTSATDDAAYTAATGLGTPAMGFATTDTVDSGDVGVLGMDTSRNLKIRIAASDVALGGGTQYTEGDTDSTITGTAVLWESTADTLVTVSATNPLPVVGAITGTVTATGPLTDTQLRATAVPVSGTVTASGPLTDTQLRATAVPVSGTITASGPLTDTQLRATAVPISGTIILGAGSSIAGKVGIDQTTPGTTNLVQVGGTLPALSAGSALIGKVGIDQTTPGTTNLVQVGGTLPALSAGTSVIGKTRGTSASFDVTFTLDTAAYATGDVLVVPQAISSVMSANNGTALLHSVTLNDKDDQGQALDLVFLRSNVSLGTINAAVSISDANADEIYGIVSVASADWVDLGGCRVATKSAIGLLCKSASGSTDLYIGAISRGTGTYTASGMTAKISFASVD